MHPTNVCSSTHLVRAWAPHDFVHGCQVLTPRYLTHEHLLSPYTGVLPVDTQPLKDYACSKPHQHRDTQKDCSLRVTCTGVVAAGSSRGKAAWRPNLQQVEAITHTAPASCIACCCSGGAGTVEHCPWLKRGRWRLGTEGHEMLGLKSGCKRERRSIYISARFILHVFFCLNTRMSDQKFLLNGNNLN